MKEAAEFQRYQRALTAHLRSPQQHNPPCGVSPHRVAVHADLIFNNFNGFLESTFPVLRRVLKKKRWQQTVRACLSEYRSPYPLFRHIPLAFLDWLATLDLAARGLPPFAVELAHYEWLELKLDMDPRRARWRKHAYAPLEQALPVNPVLELHAYRFPVHCIGPDQHAQQPAAAPVFLLLWRNRAHQVRFMTLNAAAAQLLCALQQGESAINAVTRLGLPVSDRHDELQQLLDRWLAEDILLGRARPRLASSSRR